MTAMARMERGEQRDKREGQKIDDDGDRYAMDGDGDGRCRRTNTFKTVASLSPIGPTLAIPAQPRSLSIVGLDLVALISLGTQHETR